MKFLNTEKLGSELTYSDVFLVPQYSDVESRFEVDLSPIENIGTNIPIVVANMNAVAGKRLSETVARRGGLVVLPQDIPMENLTEIVRFIKSRNLRFDTALTMSPKNTVSEAMEIIHKRAHDAVIVVGKNGLPVGIFRQSDGIERDPFLKLEDVMGEDVLTLEENLKPEEMFERMSAKKTNIAIVVQEGKILGVVTKRSAVRSSIYQPAVDKNGSLMVAVAVGINGDVAAKVRQLLDLGVDVLVMDTAHGHQMKMINAVKAARSVDSKVTIVAGNIVTAEATRDLIKAGANIVKVGVGPGAMCTTRMMTGVGRPQFSAVLECARAAKELGGFVWADGGVKHPRDVALALAAGASSVMLGSMFAGTFESAADIMKDEKGHMYKENFGMASKKAVKNRVKAESAFSRMKKEFFEEGISTSRIYINNDRPGAEDVIDSITAGLRSAMTYSGARDLEEFGQKAVIGVQKASGYLEGQAHSVLR